MRDSVRKWGARALWVLPTLLALYCVVMLADLVWFRTQIPLGFYNANWTGSWESDQYVMPGRLLVRLPDPLPENEDFKAEALVYYPIYCPWRTGRFVKMDFAGNFNPDEAASSGQSSNPIPNGGGGGSGSLSFKKGGKLSFRGVVGDQVVEYVAVVDSTRTRIVGGYLSRSPRDYGFFSIRYY